jgi:alkyl hydroperoxide reductase subunit AhpF
MAFLEEKDRIEVQKRLNEMEHPVKVINFTQKFECQFCKETRRLLEEVAGLSDKITLETYDFEEHKEQNHPGDV